MKTSKKLIGEVCIDSGQLMLCDPCHADVQSDPDDFGEHCIVNDHDVPIAVFTSTGLGDGIYPVYATYCPNGRVLRVTIEFKPDNWSREDFGEKP